jgi:hypothetical protein
MLCAACRGGSLRVSAERVIDEEKSVVTLAAECPNQTKAEEVYWNFGEDILSRFVEEPWKFGCPSK